jgi:deoxyribonucleoside regulator
MGDNQQRDDAAVTAARMYYQSGHSTDEIARYLHVSRSTVSRLLSYARESGIVEIRIRSQRASSSALQAELAGTFPRVAFHVVEVQPSFTQARVLDAVLQYAAHAVTEMVQPGMTIGLAWGNTVSGIIDHLRPHPVPDVSVVQLNGAGNQTGLGISYASDIVARFARVYSAEHFLFPVPAFFDHPETKEALWRERSIQQILAVQERADLLLFSTGGLVGDTVSYVYSAGYLTDEEAQGLRDQGVIGDIATVFFKEDGSGDLPINHRSTGPPLSLYRRASRAVCVASGDGKVPGLIAALRAGYITDLIIDERAAAELRHTLRASGGRRSRAHAAPASSALRMRGSGTAPPSAAPRPTS